jgi:hypothetical protein
MTSDASVRPTPAVTADWGHLGLEPISIDIRTGLCSRAEIPPGKGLARPETGGDIFGGTCRFRATETARSPVSSGKAAETQRLFRRRQEIGFAQDCVVVDASLPQPVSNPNSLLTGKITGNFSICGPFGRFSPLIGEQIHVVTTKFPTQRNRE